MTSHARTEFRRQLRRTPARPDSPAARYAAAGAVAGWGIVSIVEAESEPIFLSG